MSRSGLAIAFTVLAALLAASALAEDAARSPTGGVTSPTGAMIFYLAHGRDGSCGPNCSEWIAAEGVVEWDTFKRLFAFLQHLGDRKAPVVLEVWGAGDLNVAVTLGKIIRDHQLDVTAGTTVVAQCAKVTEAACFALKRSGQPLDAVLDTSCVFWLWRAACTARFPPARRSSSVRRISATGSPPTYPRSTNKDCRRVSAIDTDCI
jgi:hypothetical protein